MTIDAGDRRMLHERLEDVLGERPADLLMTRLYDDGVALVRSDVAELGLRLDAMLEAFDRRFEAIDRRFDEFDRRFEALERRMDRAEDRLTSMDDRIHSVWRALVGGFLVTIFSSWGLVLATLAMGVV